MGMNSDSKFSTMGSSSITGDPEEYAIGGAGSTCNRRPAGVKTAPTCRHDFRDGDVCGKCDAVRR